MFKGTCLIKMVFRKSILLVSLLVATNCFADDDVTLFLPNTVVPNACIPTDVNTNTIQMIPVYQNNTYTCESGYYLPVNGTECTICPSNSWCPGGDLVFSESEDVGINPCPDNMTSDEGSADVSDCSADIHCDAGYYLPANSLVCERCQNNYYCPGGDLTPADADVGINECPAGLVAPAGTADIGNCGKVMRIGNNVLYLTQTRQTTPALAARIDGVVYYARTTPVSNGLRHINENTTDYLRTNIDGTEYSIHDNTVVFDE